MHSLLFDSTKALLQIIAFPLFQTLWSANLNLIFTKVALVTSHFLITKIKRLT